MNAKNQSDSSERGLFGGKDKPRIYFNEHECRTPYTVGSWRSCLRGGPLISRVDLGISIFQIESTTTVLFSLD